MNKKLSILFGLLMTISMLLAACGPTATPTTAPEGETPVVEADPTATTEAAAEAVELRVWGHQSPSFNAAYQPIIDSYMAENPNVTVKYETFPWEVFIQTLQTSLPAGNEADVIILPGGNTCKYGLGGQLSEVPADVLTLADAQKEFYDAPIGNQTCDGKLFGFPIEYNLEYGGAYVNPALFEAAGVAYPPAWKTWDEMVADAAKLTQVGPDGVMTVAGLHYTIFDAIYTFYLAGILEQGGQYHAADGKHFTFNTPESIATIQKFMDMAQKDKVVDPVLFNNASNWVGTSFAEGHVAIGILGSWYGSEIKTSYPDLEFGYAALPPFFGTEHKFTSTGGWGIVVGKSTKAPAEAWKLASYMARTKAFDFNASTGTIPGTRSVAADPKFAEAVPALKDIIPMLGGGQFQGDMTDTWLLESEVINPNILDAMQGLQTAEEAAKKIDEQANALADKK
jgi:multiple sugar transport system substrate-binding protein